jgi:hypothetical protein
MVARDRASRHNLAHRALYQLPTFQPNGTSVKFRFLHFSEPLAIDDVGFSYVMPGALKVPRIDYRLSASFLIAS